MVGYNKSRWSEVCSFISPVLFIITNRYWCTDQSTPVLLVIVHVLEYNTKMSLHANVEKCYYIELIFEIEYL